jgi:hypothetical protein
VDRHGSRGQESAGLVANDEGRILVRHDHPRLGGQPAHDAARVAGSPRQKEDIAEPAGPGVATIGRDTVEDELMDPVVRRGIVGTERLVDEDRKTVRIALLDGVVERRVAPHPACRLRPAEDVGAAAVLLAAASGHAQGVAVDRLRVGEQVAVGGERERGHAE